MSRDDLVRLGRAGRPWEFLGVAAAALAIAPMDHGIRFLAAANLARLGLKTIAQEMLDRVPESVRHHPDITALSAALSGLPNDQLPPSTREQLLRGNLDVLAERGTDLRGLIASWRERAAEVECFRCLDGNIVRRVAHSPKGDLRVLAWWRDDRGRAAESAKSLRRADRSFADTAVVEGIDPPWTLIEARKATEADYIGHRPRLWVVQAEPTEAMEGLSMADLREALRDPRMEFLIGGGATGQLRDSLRAGLEQALPAVLLFSPGVKTPASPALSDMLNAVTQEQCDELERLHASVWARYADRDLAYWHARYTRPQGRPLRVLIPVSRFSTFVRHAAADLAGALRRAGCQAEVLQEPDDHSRLSAVAYARALDDLDPDLVVSINIPRHQLRNVFPENLPFVCWLQDAMPHLFDERAGKSQGPMDFLAGYLFGELFSKFGYPRDRAFPSTVVADGAKFHPAAVAPSLADRFRCDIAFVSHHSESPDAMHQRLAREAPEPSIREAFERLRPDVHAAVSRCDVFPPSRALRTSVIERLRETLGAEPPERTVSLVLRLYAMPLADRVLRHEMVGWAADLSHRRGLRLHLYGKGWDKHATFREFARGTLDHSEELRAAYQCASVNLHTSISALVHQRVLECALSGGVTLVRFQRDAFAGPKTSVQLALLDLPADIDEPDRLGYVIADHPRAMSLTALYARIGAPLADHVFWIPKARAEALRRDAFAHSIDQDANQVLGDLGEFSFAAADRLAMLVDRALTNPTWRTAASKMQARFPRAHLTYDSFVGRLFESVRKGLAGGAA
ncbi:hypothetical protein PHYC_02912 [Phycisphaerales bacterium]|nr:hypothetical protein PHYC_02912 [Phycisphaerales bacterium]